MPNKSKRKQKMTLRRKVVIFSALLFTFIFIVGSMAFIMLMDGVMHASSGDQLLQTVEIERLKLENHVNSELALMLKIAKSPLVIRYFEKPDDVALQTLVFEEMISYRDALAGKTLFWVNDKDKKFYVDAEYAYEVDPDAPDNYWYNMSLYHTEKYNFNINYNPDLNNTNLWINVPVFNAEGAAIAIVGTGVDLTAFLDSIYKDYSQDAHLYFFNADGEITGAGTAAFAADKAKIYDVVETVGEEIFAQAGNIMGDKVQVFKVEGWNGVIAVGEVSTLEWYVAAVLPFKIMDALQTQMTFLFVAMMLILATAFIIVNLFVAGILLPLGRMVSSINKITSEWDTKHPKDEMGTLGEFLGMALIDPLTGIHNRRYMEENMNSIIKTLRRSGGGTLSVLMLDIDFFKKYNDTYGHAMGDSCLQVIAKAIAASVTRDDDFAARYGGEEFAVILPNTGKDGAGIIAERILENVRERNIPHSQSEVAECVTVSIGVATRDVSDFAFGADLIKLADAALYSSKANGRNRITYSEPETEPVLAVTPLTPP